MPGRGAVTPLASWFPDARARVAARRRLGRVPLLFPARDRAWRAVAPDGRTLRRLARTGLPFQIVADRRYDRSGRVSRLGPALRAGKTVLFPQIHQVLPRVARLMVALRVALFDGARDECSFLFLVDGRGREGLGLHHDGDVHAFWLQLEGRRTVTLGPPVGRGTPEELPDAAAPDARVTTRALAPGSLLYLPPRTPHRVVCYERSVALSLTWSVARTRGSRIAPGWDVASGRVLRRPRAATAQVWAQVPTTVDRRGRLVLPDGRRVAVAHLATPMAGELGFMPVCSRAALGSALPALEAHGIVGGEDLPIAVVPDRPSALDGWHFA